MMGVDATTRAEVMLCGVGVELVKREQFAAPSNVDAIQIRGHRNRPAHATVRTRTTPRRTKPIGQPCCEPHRTAMAGPVHRIHRGHRPRLLISCSNESPYPQRTDARRKSPSPLFAATYRFRQ